MFATVVLLRPETPRTTGTNVANQTVALNTPVKGQAVPWHFATVKLTVLFAMLIFPRLY